MMGWSFIRPEGVKSSSLRGIGGGSSPFTGTPSVFDPPRVRGVIGDLGVLSPECEVRGEEGGLPSREEFCFDFRSMASCDAMAIGEAEVSACAATEGGARVRRRVHVTMSVLSSV